jgi:putative ABC transport system substrate-binding protein
LLLLPIFAYCEEITVVIVKPQADIAIFKQIISGFKETIGADMPSALVKEYGFSGKNDNFDALKSLHPNVIFAIGGDQIGAILKNTENIPVVSSELVRQSKAIRTDNRIALVSLDVPPEFRLQYVKKVMPKVRRVGIIYDPQQNSEMVENYMALARSMDMDVVKFPVITMRQVQETRYRGADVLLFIPDSFVCQTLSVKNIIVSAFKDNVPVVGLAGLYAQAGAVLAVEPDYADHGRQAAEAALRILNGEKPEDIPVSFCRKLRYFVNTAMVSLMGIEMSPDFVKNADQVFGDK